MRAFSPSRAAGLALAALMLGLLAACNTTAGVGKDVSAAGRTVTDTANKVKNGL